MDYFRKRVQDDTSLAASVVHQLRLSDECNLLKTHVDDTIDIEEILTEIFIKKSRRKSRKRLVLGSLNTQSIAWIYSDLPYYCLLNAKICVLSSLCF